MNITNVPQFDKGLETLCRAKTFLSLAALDGATTAESFHTLITAPTSPYPEMIGFQMDKVAKLDGANSEVAKIQSIWAKFGGKPVTAESLWSVKTELQDWISSYETTEPVQCFSSVQSEGASLSRSIMSKTPVIFVKGLEAPDLNAFKAEDSSELIKELAKFLKIIKIPECGDFFNKIIMQIFLLGVFKEGRKLLQEIISNIGTNKITFKSGQISQVELNSYTVEISDKKSTCIYECPDRIIPDNFVLKSLETPIVATFAHELLHVLHTLQNLPVQNYPAGSHMASLYTSHEEERTIRGSASAIISENSIGDSINLYPRYGHVGGNLEGNEPNHSIDHACSFGIYGDLDWIIPSVKTPSSLADIYQRNHDLLKDAFSNKTFAKTRKKLKRKLAKEAKASKRPEKATKQPTLSQRAIVNFPLSTSDISHNRILVLEKIQVHMVQNQMDTSTLIPPTPVEEELVV